MKTFFTNYGWRDTKSWSCPYCENFHVGGMDLFVDASVRKHLTEDCTALSNQAPRFTGFDNVPEFSAEDASLQGSRDYFAERCEHLSEKLLQMKKAAEERDDATLRKLLEDTTDCFQWAILWSYMPVWLVDHLKLRDAMEAGHNRLAR